MELVNEFRVDAPVDRAWRLLTDLERVAPCLPGATLTDVSDEAYRGTVRIKVGPVTVRYRGVARFEQLDTDSHVAILVAEGREAQGQGRFRAVLRAELTADGGSSSPTSRPGTSTAPPARRSWSSSASSTPPAPRSS